MLIFSPIHAGCQIDFGNWYLRDHANLCRFFSLTIHDNFVILDLFLLLAGSIGNAGELDFSRDHTAAYYVFINERFHIGQILGMLVHLFLKETFIELLVEFKLGLVLLKLKVVDYPIVILFKLLLLFVCNYLAFHFQMAIF